MQTFDGIEMTRVDLPQPIRGNLVRNIDRYHDDFAYGVHMIGVPALATEVQVDHIQETTAHDQQQAA